jgi:ribosomal protein L7/L12
VTVVDLKGLARRLRSEGIEWDEVLARLRCDGATIIESVKIVRELDSVTLGKAKDLVDSSIAWSDQFSENDALRKTAIEALEADT